MTGDEKESLLSKELLSEGENAPIAIREVDVLKEQGLLQKLVALWRASVEATHTFLTADGIERIAGYVAQAIEGVAHVAVAQNSRGVLLGFVGAEGDTVEMLFVHPAVRGKGVGTCLLEHVINTYGANKVDVNEQNDQARGFYEHVGFEVISRSETDGMGDPFPILHMQLTSGC